MEQSTASWSNHPPHSPQLPTSIDSDPRRTPSNFLVFVKRAQPNPVSSSVSVMIFRYRAASPYETIAVVVNLKSKTVIVRCRDPQSLHGGLRQNTIVVCLTMGASCRRKYNHELIRRCHPSTVGVHAFQVDSTLRISDFFVLVGKNRLEKPASRTEVLRLVIRCVRKECRPQVHSTPAGSRISRRTAFS